MDQGRIVLVNDRAEQLFGWPRAELLGREAEMLLSEAARESYPEQLTRRWTAPDAGLMGTISLDVVRRDGTSLPVEASLAMVETPQGRVIVAVIRDITERRRAEEDKARLR